MPHVALAFILQTIRGSACRSVSRLTTTDGVWRLPMCWNTRETCSNLSSVFRMCMAGCVRVRMTCVRMWLPTNTLKRQHKFLCMRQWRCMGVATWNSTITKVRVNFSGHFAWMKYKLVVCCWNIYTIVQLVLNRYLPKWMQFLSSSLTERCAGTTLAVIFTR